MPKDVRKVMALCGSTKNNSTNQQILIYLKEGYAHLLDIEIFSDLDKLPFFNPDVQDVPLEVKKLRTGIEKADGVLICTPEYVFSLPGVLKNAIEWTVSTTLFSNKAVAAIVASASGEKAFESLKLIMSTIEARIPDEATLLIRGAKGKLVSGKPKDAVLETALAGLMEAFIACMEEPNPVPSKYKGYAKN